MQDNKKFKFLESAKSEEEEEEKIVKFVWYQDKVIEPEKKRVQAPPMEENPK